MTGLTGKNTELRYMICVDNEGYPTSLELLKLYQVLPGSPGERELGLIRVVDESGDSYLYPDSRFMPADLPEETAYTVERLLHKTMVERRG